ncbi:MAG TPA: phosphoenolpyruvate hydrolase family protein [Mycobacteriales bacterium]
MATRHDRQAVLRRLNATTDRGEALLVAGAGVGLVAKCAELAGADVVAVYSSGRFRMNGWPSTAAFLPVGNANDIALELGRTAILPAVREVPVVAGVFAADFTRDMRQLLAEMWDTGFSGVINFPTVGRLDGTFRRDLESLGFGLDRELEMFRLARELELFTMAYAYNPQDAAAFADAGVDVVIAHMGLTAGGLTGHAEPITLEAAAESTQVIIEAATAARPDVIPLCHGGPVSTPDDVAFVLAHTTARGFVGASSIERLPIEAALEASVRGFKSVPLPGRGRA